MPACECLNGCPFFNGKMPENSGMGTIYRNKYCLGDNSKCARYMIFKRIGKQFVPSDLYPNMYDRAQQLIASH